MSVSRGLALGARRTLNAGAAESLSAHRIPCRARLAGLTVREFTRARCTKGLQSSNSGKVREPPAWRATEIRQPCGATPVAAPRASSACAYGSNLPSDTSTAHGARFAGMRDWHPPRASAQERVFCCFRSLLLPPFRGFGTGRYQSMVILSDTTFLMEGSLWWPRTEISTASIIRGRIISALTNSSSSTTG